MSAATMGLVGCTAKLGWNIGALTLTLPNPRALARGAARLARWGFLFFIAAAFNRSQPTVEPVLSATAPTTSQLPSRPSPSSGRACSSRAASSTASRRSGSSAEIPSTARVREQPPSTDSRARLTARRSLLCSQPSASALQDEHGTEVRNPRVSASRRCRSDVVVFRVLRSGSA